MKRQYLVRIDKDVDSDWGASVPDLPGCVATGKTIDAALRRISGRANRDAGRYTAMPLTHRSRRSDE